MPVASKQARRSETPVITTAELMKIIDQVKPPGTIPEYMKIITKFMVTWDKIPEDFKPKDSFAYKSMMTVCLDKSASEVLNISRGSDSWARVARMFYTKLPYESYVEECKGSSS